MDKHLGFIGVGNMGLPMATRLADAGYALTLFDVRKEAFAPLLARGAQAATSPAAVASECATVILSLPNPPIVRDVLLGENGVSAGSKVKTVIDLSTTGPRMTATLADALAKKGITLVDSPVSGGVAGAVKGTLAVMVATDEARFQALQPLLANIGKVFHVGPTPGMGQTMKLCNNLLSATNLAAAMEVVTRVDKTLRDQMVATGWLGGVTAALLASLAGFGTGLAGPSRDMLIKRASPPGATGRVYGTVYSGLDVGFAVAAPVFGWLLDHDRPNSVFVGAALALALGVMSAGVVALRIRATQPDMAIGRA